MLGRVMNVWFDTRFWYFTKNRDNGCVGQKLSSEIVIEINARKESDGQKVNKVGICLGNGSFWNLAIYIWQSKKVLKMVTISH